MLVDLVEGCQSFVMIVEIFSDPPEFRVVDLVSLEGTPVGATGFIRRQVLLGWR